MRYLYLRANVSKCLFKFVKFTMGLYNHCRLMFHLACQLPTGFEFPQLPLSAGTDWFYQQISKPQNKIVPTVMITGSMDLIM